MRKEKTNPYRTYLLRCWREGDASPSEAPTWRFSVEEILDERRRRGFGSLDDLVAFLRTELAGGEASNLMKTQATSAMRSWVKKGC